MGWVESEKDQKDREAARLTGSNQAGAPEYHEKKVQAGGESMRMLELELENLRLTRLVADLLLKNQQLRESN